MLKMDIVGRKKYSCKYPGCNNWYYTKVPEGFVNKHFFQFPKNEKYHEEWRKICQIDVSVSSRFSCVCQDHFVDSAFVNARKNKLNFGAVPVALHQPSGNDEHSRISPTCCVPDCPRTNPILHEFPIPDKKRRWKTLVSKIWLYRVFKEIHEDEETLPEVTKMYRICDFHFSDTCKLPSYNKLKKGSLPTLLLPNFTEESNERNCHLVELLRSPEAEEIKMFVKYQPEKTICGTDSHIQTSTSKSLFCEVEDSEKTLQATDNQELLQSESVRQKPNFKSLKLYSINDKCVSEVCRICFCTITDHDMIKLYKDPEEFQEGLEEMRGMLKTVLPDLDLDMYENAVICTKCKHLLKPSFELKMAWLATEKKLQNIIENQIKDQNKPNSSIVLVAGTLTASAAKSQKKFNHSVIELDHDYTSRGTSPTETYPSTKTTLKTDDGNLISSNKVIQESPNFSDIDTQEFNVTPEQSFEGANVDAVTTRRGKNRDPFQCELCGVLIKNPSWLKRHMLHHERKLERQIQQQQRGMCEACGRIYDSVAQLKRHIYYKHRNTTKTGPEVIIRYQCEVCDKILTTKRALQKHIRHIHLKIYNYVQCDICGKQFAARCYLKAHLLSHRSEKKYACKICGKRISRQPGLVKHILKHSASKVECEFCGKIVKYESSLRKHIKVFHMNEGKSNCEFCGKPYWKKYDLMRHIIKIHGWRPHSEQNAEQNELPTVQL